MNISEAREILRNAAWLGTDEERERIEKAVEVVLGEPCSDTISRQAVIESFRMDDDGTPWDMKDIIYRLEQFPSISDLPLVQSIIPRGHWIDEGWYADGYDQHSYRCSECGQHIIEIPARLMDENPHCKYCGVEMQESEEV